MPSKARIIVGALLAVAIIIGAVYTVWGDWDRGRIIGAGAGRDDRTAFAEALERRFDELTPVEHRETCDDVRANGLEISIAYIRERHYAQPGGPRMPFFDDLAAEILIRECLIPFI